MSNLEKWAWRLLWLGVVGGVYTFPAIVDGAMAGAIFGPAVAIVFPVAVARPQGAWGPADVVAVLANIEELADDLADQITGRWIVVALLGGVFIAPLAGVLRRIMAAFYACVASDVLARLAAYLCGTDRPSRAQYRAMWLPTLEDKHPSERTAYAASLLWRSARDAVSRQAHAGWLLCCGACDATIRAAISPTRQPGALTAISMVAAAVFVEIPAAG